MGARFRRRELRVITRKAPGTFRGHWVMSLPSASGAPAPLQGSAGANAPTESRAESDAAAPLVGRPAAAAARCRGQETEAWPWETERTPDPFAQPRTRPWSHAGATLWRDRGGGWAVLAMQDSGCPRLRW